VIMMIAMLAMANCMNFSRLYIGPQKLPAVSVTDDEGKPLYGVVLGPNDSYESYIMRARFGMLGNFCTTEA